MNQPAHGGTPCTPNCMMGVLCGKDGDIHLATHAFKLALSYRTNRFKVASVNGSVNQYKPYCSWTVHYQHTTPGLPYYDDKRAKPDYNEILMGIPQGLILKEKCKDPSKDSYIVQYKAIIECTTCQKPNFDFITTHPNIGVVNKKFTKERTSVKSEIAETCKGLAAATLNPNTNVAAGCPAPYLSYARGLFPASIVVSGQNCYKVSKGAFTGDVSATMLKKFGVDWIIIGHSERRQTLGESDELIAEKTAHALAKGLKVIGCIGETLQERAAGQTETVLFRQTKALANAIKDWTNVVVAYEPVWAIENGKTATPQQLQDVHAALRKWFTENVSTAVRVQYGGSVAATNCKELTSPSHIDGFLIDGSSLKPEFVQIITIQEFKQFDGDQPDEDL